MQMSKWGDHRTVHYQQCKAEKKVVDFSEVERVVCAGDAEGSQKAVQSDLPLTQELELLQNKSK
jgi:hypothetical protein